MPEIYRRESEVIQEQREIQRTARAFKSDPECAELIEQIGKARAEERDRYLEKAKTLEYKCRNRYKRCLDAIWSLSGIEVVVLDVKAKK